MSERYVCVACGTCVELPSEQLGCCPVCCGDRYEDASGTYAKPLAYGPVVNAYPYPGHRVEVVSNVSDPITTWEDPILPLLDEVERLTERMAVVLEAGPSTALATAIFDRAKKAEAALVEARELLQEAQRDSEGCCPICHAYVDFMGLAGKPEERAPHRPDCKLDAFLKRRPSP